MRPHAAACCPTTGWCTSSARARRYLRDRRPTLLNHNPQLTFRDEEGAGRQGQAARTARMLGAAAMFLRTLESGALEPDVFHLKPRRTDTVQPPTARARALLLTRFKRRAQPLWKEVMRWMPRSHAFYAAAVTNAYPLDMSQYANLFRSTRVPLPGRDELRTFDGSRHVVVQRGARFWALDILDESGATLPVAQLHAALQARAAIPRPAPARSRSRLCQSRPKPA